MVGLLAPHGVHAASAAAVKGCAAAHGVHHIRPSQCRPKCPASCRVACRRQVVADTLDQWGRSHPRKSGRARHHACAACQLRTGYFSQESLRWAIMSRVDAFDSQ